MLSRQVITRRVPIKELKALIPIQDTYKMAERVMRAAHEDGSIGAPGHGVPFKFLVLWSAQKNEKTTGNFYF